MHQPLRFEGDLLGLMEPNTLREAQNAAAQQPRHQHQRKQTPAAAQKHVETAQAGRNTAHAQRDANSDRKQTRTQQSGNTPRPKAQRKREYRRNRRTRGEQRIVFGNPGIGDNRAPKQVALSGAYPTQIESANEAYFFSPIPETRLRSSTVLNGPLACLSATIR